LPCRFRAGEWFHKLAAPGAEMDRMIEAICDAERKILAEREECPCKDGMFPRLSRGRVVFAAGGGRAAEAAVDQSACAGQRRRRHEPERRAKAALRLEA
jgi:hypothetical protein